VLIEPVLDSEEDRGFGVLTSGLSITTITSGFTGFAISGTSTSNIGPSFNASSSSFFFGWFRLGSIAGFSPTFKIRVIPS
jgi:hypothetical protein